MAELCVFHVHIGERQAGFYGIVKQISDDTARSHLEELQLQGNVSICNYLNILETKSQQDLEFKIHLSFAGLPVLAYQRMVR